jgi:NNP family nitrate/nitrite transporter-like MFS transporter
MLCFFSWFGIAPLMAVVRDDLGLTREQIGNTIIASVLATVFARLLIGYLCDRWGPRLTYGVLLLTGSVPVMAIGLAQSYEQFLVCRLLIGCIGASFVITQYHTSIMYALKVVGTANATTAGWGNLGGGLTQIVMPLIFGAVLLVVPEEAVAWRVAMVIPGLVTMAMGVAYLPAPPPGDRIIMPPMPSGRSVAMCPAPGRCDRTSHRPVAPTFRVGWPGAVRDS